MLPHFLFLNCLVVIIVVYSQYLTSSPICLFSYTNQIYLLERFLKIIFILSYPIKSLQFFYMIIKVLKYLGHLALLLNSCWLGFSALREGVLTRMFFLFYPLFHPPFLISLIFPFTSNAFLSPSFGILNILTK